MNQNIDIIGVILDCVIFAGSACIICFPLDKKRIRARWANFLFVATGLIGILVHVVWLAYDMRWIMLDGNAGSAIRMELHFVNGILVGFLLALIFSGQLRGIKRPVEN
ncbi:MAG: hypothetical protein ABSG87_06645 [Verrucomicrobiota bacterium]|jgi:hypothetical protein